MTRFVSNPNARWLQGGYVLVACPTHPRAYKRQNATGMMFEHVLVAEKALGHYLPPKAQVHHVNGVKLDNRNTNLVICEDTAYHLLLHARQRVLEAGGDPDTHYPCRTCGQIKELRTRNFSVNSTTWTGFSYRCKECLNSADRKRYQSAHKLGPRRAITTANIRLGRNQFKNILECGHEEIYHRKSSRKAACCSQCNTLARRR